MKRETADREWYELREPETVPTPRLLVSRDRVVENIQAAIDAAGAPDRLRPHVKTHKSADVVALHLERGIRRFKCATPAEAAMLARAGAPDILVAYQLIGPNLEAVCTLARRHPDVRFGCVLDNVHTFDRLEDACRRHDVTLAAYVDLDVGMHRTGIAAGPEADELYRGICASQVLRAGGIHAYDGHIRDSDPAERRARAAVTRELAFAMRDRLRGQGHPVDEIVTGGTPTFPCHAAAYEAGMSLSPGTYSYHDWGYGSNFPDLPFKAAAVVFGRVISVSGPGRFTVDVGSKAIAADPAQPRGTILNYPATEAGPQSEEHWVFTIPEEQTPSVGSPVYIWPKHICPTVEHYDEAAVLDGEGYVREYWLVTARGRRVE